MNNEPVAWMIMQDGKSFFANKFEVMQPNGFDKCIPLYTAEQLHPAKELNAGGEPVKNATYWKRQYNEMSALNDRLKSSLYHANEQIKYLETHPAKTLTDEEISHAVGFDDGFKAGMQRAVEMNLAKTLTDDEIENIAYKVFEISDGKKALFDFARAILRKAQEV